MHPKFDTLYRDRAIDDFGKTNQSQTWHRTHPSICTALRFPSLSNNHSTAVSRKEITRQLACRLMSDDGGRGCLSFYRWYWIKSSRALTSGKTTFNLPISILSMRLELEVRLQGKSGKRHFSGDISLETLVWRNSKFHINKRYRWRSIILQSGCCKDQMMTTVRTKGGLIFALTDDVTVFLTRKCHLGKWAERRDYSWPRVQKPRPHRLLSMWCVHVELCRNGTRNGTALQCIADIAVLAQKWAVNIFFGYWNHNLRKASSSIKTGLLTDLLLSDSSPLFHLLHTTSKSWYQIDKTRQIEILSQNL